MGYNPKIKNLPELIQDLQKIVEGKVKAKEVKEKMDTLDYQHDPTDGFEDILDSIRPFMKSLIKVDSIEKNSEVKTKLTELIGCLKEEKALEELERIRI